MIVVSWNMQGAWMQNAGRTLETSNLSDALGLLKHGVTALCLQEAGACPYALPRQTVGNRQIDVGTIQIGSSTRGRQALVAWYDSCVNIGASHNRCSMAIVSTSFTGSVDVIEHQAATLRPLLGIELANGDWLYSVHAPSGNHNTASGVANSLLGQIAGARRFTCVGDYNCDPNDMTARGHSPISGADATHQNGNRLDFAIARGPTVSMAAPAALGLTQLVSDHYGQTFNIV